MGSPSLYKKRILGIEQSGEKDADSQVIVDDYSEEDSEADSEDKSGRSAFERDLDRIKYTEEFRRLKDVTQVARAGESYLYHDRLSHSLKVAQVGRRFAEYIRRQEGKDEPVSYEVNPAMVEAGCLAHDLGHPPFGHLAESTLDELLQEKTNPYLETNDLTPSDADLPENLDPADIDDLDAYLQATQGEDLEENGLSGIRFEGNAQSFRILTRLANHRDAHSGLALTVGVLLSVGKYPYGRGEWFNSKAHDKLDPWPEEPESVEGRSTGKFGFYEEDKYFSKTVRYAGAKGEEFVEGRTAAAGIMDYADDLTYAIHDLTDFYMDGRLPLDRLLREALAEVDPDDEEGLNETDYEQAPRRELKDLHDELEYDADIATPTDVVTSLVTTAILVGENLSLLEPFTGESEQRDELEAFTSFLIEYYLNEIYYSDLSDHDVEDTNDAYVTLQCDDEKCELYLSERLEEQLSILQQITRYYVIQQPSLMAQQRGQREIIRETFEALYEEAGKENLSWSAIPSPYRDRLEADYSQITGLNNTAEEKARVVADFITAMTEPQLVALHERLTGTNPGSLQDQIVR